MRKLLLISGAAALVALLVAAIGGIDLGRLLNPGLYARFGNFGGVGRSTPGSEPFHPDAIKYGIRWFPTHVSFGPDNDTLLVSLCHVDGPGYCRIGRYSLSQDRWDVYAAEQRMTYTRPLFSPDGQWIYYSAAYLCEDLRNYCDHPRLYRMHPDGTGAEMFADVVVVDPSFSVDGKRLIYWGQMSRNALANTEVHYLDIETRRVVQLTENIPHPTGPAFLLADGKHFIFQGGLDYWRGHTTCTADPKEVPADPKTGKKEFGSLFGNKAETGLYLAAIEDAPIGKDNCRKLTPFWGDDSGHKGGSPCAMDGQGRFLYQADRLRKRQEGNSAALALRPADPHARRPLPLSIEEERKKYPFAMLTEKQLREGEGAKLDLKRSIESDHYFLNVGSAAFLRRIADNAPDEAAFDAGCGSLDRDARQLAFTWGGTLPGNMNAVAVLRQGAPLKEIRLILNWPKLDLKSTLPANR